FYIERLELSTEGTTSGQQTTTLEEQIRFKGPKSENSPGPVIGILPLFDTFKALASNLRGLIRLPTFVAKNHTEFYPYEDQLRLAATCFALSSEDPNRVTTFPPKIFSAGTYWYQIMYARSLPVRSIAPGEWSILVIETKTKAEDGAKDIVPSFAYTFLTCKPGATSCTGGEGLEGYSRMDFEGFLDAVAASPGVNRFSESERDELKNIWGEGMERIVARTKGTLPEANFGAE
ncbi:hypothetical protein MMC25_000212, partial [Agyrium rufum]|nr:hypothetical protein [Agyrium rufum]